MIRLAVLASGGGSNAEKIIEHFRGHNLIEVTVIVSSKATAGVVKIAEREKIPVLVLEKEKFLQDGFVPELKGFEVQWIILAGFLWKIPAPLLAAFPHRIVNIHPALLPKYGGKGMYGRYVHEAVIKAREEQSGITIHFVDDEYDHGDTIFQDTCEVRPDDSPETLARRVQDLEHGHYATVIEKLVLSADS